MYGGLRRAMTWLAATSIHSRDPTFWQMLSSLRQLCDVYSSLHAIINLFDHEEPTEMRRNLLQVNERLQFLVSLQPVQF